MIDVTRVAHMLRSLCNFSPAEGRREIHHQDSKHTQVREEEAIT